MGLLALAAATAGCATVGPDYKRPEVVAPEAYRGQTQAATTDATSFGDAQWATVFEDEPLRQLINEALAQNYDLRIAAARILQAEALYGITRSNQFPQVDAGASVQGQRTSANSDREAQTAGVGQLGAVCCMAT